MGAGCATVTGASGVLARGRQWPGRPRSRLAADRERGSGTVIAVGLVGVLATLLIAGLLVAAVAVAGQRARTAADLASLAAAGQLLQGGSPTAACAAGVEVAGAHGVDLVACEVTTTRAGLPRVEVESRVAIAGTRLIARARVAAGGVPAETGIETGGR